MPMPSLRCLQLVDRGLIRLAGADARPFLQGLISNDLDLLRPNSALYAALLTPRANICSTSCSTIAVITCSWTQNASG